MSIITICKFPIKVLAIGLVRYLQYRYKALSIKSACSQTNKHLSKLKLIQASLFYLKSQFSAWGYFHPDCGWSKIDERKFRELFPEKKGFKEIDIVVWYNPAAVTYYHNKIFDLEKGVGTNYQAEIKKQLVKWKRWN